ncbi:LOW QUALITY PROTEIN: hypothetical protein BRADI_2g18610v3 [Brachypodium distachyon]|uniref:Uncharacterized protein n=1 Tax=Brachypodium distachyon TaxID=15368 RepID=A0A2K2D953_BRADI|nr:LOW QUALITY PROTEIN: hypothetical protein BRADI_2g18610v3 [Brachypodium distachyon]
MKMKGLRNFVKECRSRYMILIQGDTLAASYYQQLKNATAVGAELAHSFSSSANTLTVGTQIALDRLNTVKGRFNSNGIASVLIQHAWSPKSLITVSIEFNRHGEERAPIKFGLALALKR